MYLISTITSDYTVPTTVSGIIANTASNNITIVLPNPFSIVPNPTAAIAVSYWIKKISASNTVTITCANPSILLEGASSITLTQDNQSVNLQFSGANFYIISSSSTGGGSSYITSVSDTNTVDLDVTASNLTANVLYQDTADISLSEDASGLKADLLPTTVIAGSYTNADITVDANGRITSASNGSGGTGTVTSVSAGTGMSFSTITTSGSVAIDSTKVPYLSSGFSTGLLKWNGSAWVFDNSSYLTTAITSLNGLTNSTQTFAVGTSGTDFAISSSTSTHTFNLPTASASNRGALSSTDWSTFNSKEPAITWAQGDILYGTGVNTYSKLAKNTSATRYLSNTGTSNNPAWEQVDLTNGVTGVLPIADGGTGTSNSYGVCKLWYMDLTSHSLTGTLTETSVLQIALPTNMTATRLRVTAFFRCTAYTSGTLAFRLRLGTNTGSPTSNTQVAQVALGAAQVIPIIRNYTCSTNLLEGVLFGTSLVNDESAANTYSSAAKDWTTQQYLFATIYLANTANVAELSSIQILQTNY